MKTGNTDGICYSYNMFSNKRRWGGRGSHSHTHTHARSCSEGVSPRVSWGRQREVFPLRGCQDFPRCTINFHFGKSAHSFKRARAHSHTHAHIAGGSRPVLTVNGTCVTNLQKKQQKTRERSKHKTRTGGARLRLPLPLTLVSSSEERSGDKKAQDNDWKPPFHSRLIPAQLGTISFSCFIFSKNCRFMVRSSPRNTWNGKTWSASPGL